MKLAALKPWAARQRRQDLWRRDRAAAQTLRNGFPRVERIHIDMKFVDGAAYTPADQSHILHPAAQAFFSFPCPYADCDGRFDLEAVVTGVLKSSAHSGDGDLECAGHRARDGKSEQLCGLHLRFTVSAQYERDSAAATGSSSGGERRDGAGDGEQAQIVPVTADDRQADRRAPGPVTRHR